jgi:hypothetical protein
MTPQPATVRLAALLQSLDLSAAARSHRLERVRERLFAQSRDVRQPEFRTIRTVDLEIFFDAYDSEFFEGQCRAALNGRRLSFRFARRMTRSAGHTKCTRFRDGRMIFEIAVAAPMLFEGFGPDDRRIAVCGIECPTRLDALERILEHELIHLAEMLCWAKSNCSATRFQSIATRLFGHQTHTHNLITRHERAAEKGIRLGSPVAFLFEGETLHGRVHRITKRATVLVEHPRGEPYSDGRRYRRYYVPIGLLELKS